MENLRKILRFHYREKDATALYKDLVGLTQATQESAQDFLLRALDIRQKVAFASREVESDIVYDGVLVKKMFLNAVLTGLRSESIKNEIRPVLQNAEVTDSELLDAMYVAAQHDSERTAKLGKIAAVKVIEQDFKNEQNKSDKKAKGNSVTAKSNKVEVHESDLAAQISELRTDLKKLQTQSQASKTEKSESQSASPGFKERKPRKACQACTDGNCVGTCDHCWRCGSDEHYSRGCKKALNRNGPAWRDRR